MKQCTTHIIEWDSSQESFVELPSNCLSYSIMNEGGSLVMINNTTPLNPKQDHPVAYHMGYYHTGQIDLEVTNTLLPYTTNTKVIIRLVIEIDQIEQ